MNAINQRLQHQIEVAYKALISVNTLSAEEREQVFGTLAKISDLPPEQWPADRICLWRPQKALYLLKATDQLRVFFTRAADGALTIEDLVMQEHLDKYAGSESAQG
jgi:hypothetical protein